MLAILDWRIKASVLYFFGFSSSGIKSSMVSRAVFGMVLWCRNDLGWSYQPSLHLELLIFVESLVNCGYLVVLYLPKKGVWTFDSAFSRVML